MCVCISSLSPSLLVPQPHIRRWEDADEWYLVTTSQKYSIFILRQIFLPFKLSTLNKHSKCEIIDTNSLYRFSFLHQTTTNKTKTKKLKQTLTLLECYKLEKYWSNQKDYCPDSWRYDPRDQANFHQTLPPSLYNIFLWLSSIDIANESFRKWIFSRPLKIICSNKIKTTR